MKWKTSKTEIYMKWRSRYTRAEPDSLSLTVSVNNTNAIQIKY